MTQKMKPLKDLVLLDRFLFAEAVEDPLVLRNMLEIILGDEIKILRHSETEKELRTSPLLRSIRMDVFTMDEDNIIYNAEVQKKNTKNLPKRSRYYQALLDSSLLEPGAADFNLLNDTFLILIAPFDLFGKGKYCYTFGMSCREDSDIQLEDGVVKIFLNTRGKNDSEVSAELVELLHYIEKTNDEANRNCTSTKVKEIQNRVSKLKTSEEMGVRYMQAWEEKVYERLEGREEGRAEGREEGIKSALEILRELGLPEGIAKEKISSKFLLTEEETQEVMKKYWAE